MVTLARGSVLMLAISELAELAGPRPLGEWQWRFQTDPVFRVFVNAGTQPVWIVDVWAIPQHHALIEHDGRPLALGSAEGGTCRVDEAVLITAIQRESSWVKR